jgi:hypothetical protein
MTQSRWLPLARTIRLIIAVFYIGTFLFSIPITLSEAPSFDSTTTGVSYAEFQAGLVQMGVSPSGYILFQQWLSIIGSFLYLALGVFIFWRKSNDWMALLTSFIFVTFLAPFDELAHLHSIWLIISDITAIIGSIILFLWFFIFPDGRFVPRWTRWIFFILLATQIWRIFQPELYQQSFIYLGPLIFGSIVAVQIYRYRHSNREQRQQIKWVVFGVVAGAVPLLLFFLLYSTVLSSQPALIRSIAFNFFGNFLWTLFVFELPISLTLAILYSRLFDIDIIIRKTVQYSVLTAVLGLVYYGSVLLLQGVFTRVTGEKSAVALVLSTLLIAALFTPSRRRIQEFIDRRFFRKKYDAAQVLAQFAQTTQNETDMEALQAELLRVVQETMQPESVSIWIKR